MFPEWSTPALDTVSGLGLLLFLFLVGLELDFRAVRRMGSRSVAIAAAGIVPPLLAVAGIVPLLDLAIPAPRQASYLSLCVFLGAALSVTALPVLACILKELGLLGVPFGETAMAAAAVNDVFAWTLLALALAVSGGGREPKGSPLAPVYILSSGAVFVAFTFFALRPLMARLARRAGPCSSDGNLACSCAVACALLAGAVTDAIGVHPVFGAFVFGLAMPRVDGVAERVGEKVTPLVSGIRVDAAALLRHERTAHECGQRPGRGRVGDGGARGGRGRGGEVHRDVRGGGCRDRHGQARGCRPRRGHEGQGARGAHRAQHRQGEEVLDDTTFAIFVIMALTTTVIATALMTALYRHQSTATMPEIDGMELKGGDACPA
ncbi:unnamed protein product [Triticum turgidum subsp. durum]|uniref:Cation/H+ exchanger transmembrane domain-containing protein n=1 Tax=Triticum turgidum subsp. durum TaxID=4567 RepID=A0A9R0QW45_TRITD|nr:unnamed protein product [Triticum turgidum subsp. durum]